MPRNYIKVFGERAVRLVGDRLRDNLGVSETRVIADVAGSNPVAPTSDRLMKVNFHEARVSPC